MAGVRLSHPERALYPDIGFSKLDLARFYERIADWILPYLAGRPLTLVRCPKGLAGDCVYMKHSKVWAPEPLRRVRIQEKTKLGEYLIVDDLPGLVALVQMDILEIHTWNATFERLETPDRIVLDVDPGPKVSWVEVVEAARRIQSVLEAVGLKSFSKTTGGKGVHVVVPLRPRAHWTECLELARAVAKTLERQEPRRYTTSFARAGRQDKILLDTPQEQPHEHLGRRLLHASEAGGAGRNPRLLDGAHPRLRPDGYHVRNVESRLRKLPEDPWAEYWTCRQELTETISRALNPRSFDERDG